MEGPTSSASSSGTALREPDSPERKRSASELDGLPPQPSPSKVRRLLPEPAGRALQLVHLNMEQRRAEVDEESLKELADRLQKLGNIKVAVVSVMGAFRTGKSFLLDLFLRFLRHEDAHSAAAGSPLRPSPPHTPQASLPAWAAPEQGALEGAPSRGGGFCFRGGMDVCTQGVWVWSEPFRRIINGEPVAILLMDTQGAWDNDMTREQSATIFGLTAVLSSKQIYNINMQIQEDKVENLAYFMLFAQTALRQAAAGGEETGQGPSQEELERPFQALDFLVRDWKNFREEWSMERCKEQMQEHLAKHVDPARVREGGTAQALQRMFRRINCFCLPHPGFEIEKETWTGDMDNISARFLHFADAYMKEVFSDLDTKRIFGSELSTVTFPLIFQSFVAAFQDTAPAARSFTQAMTTSTVLIAKEKALNSYKRQMDEAAAQHPRGMDPDQFEGAHHSAHAKVLADLRRAAIFGSEDVVAEAKAAVEQSLQSLRLRYEEDNARRSATALNGLAPAVLVGLLVFVSERAVDWTCGWWLQACWDLSFLLMAVYLAIGAYAGLQLLLLNSRKQLTSSVTVELWKEILRLAFLYYALARAAKLMELAALPRRHDAAAPPAELAPPEGKKER